MLAIPWYLVSKMGDADGKLLNAQLMGTIAFLTIFWRMLSGTWIDKFNRKHIFMIQQTGTAMVLASAVLIAGMEGPMPFYLIAAGAGATIFAWSLFYPNLYAFAQELFDKSLYKKINSGIELQGQSTKFLGMLVGSVLLSGSVTISWWPQALQFGPWTLQEIFLLDVSTYLISVAVIALVRYTPGEYIRQAHASMLERLKQGFRYLRSRPPLLIFGVASHTVFVCLLVLIHVGVAVYISDYLKLSYEEGGRVMALFEAFYALGAITAGLINLFVGRILLKINLVYQIIFLLCLMAAVLLCFSLTASVTVFVCGGFLVGIANAGSRILRTTYLLRTVPNTVIGRVNSIFSMIQALNQSLIIGLLSLSFFTGAGNGGNIVYGLGLMAGLCLISALLLILFFPKFDRDAAYG